MLHPRLRLSILSHPLAFLAGIALVVSLIVYGTRSDYDELHPFVGELLPAGHCLCHTSVTFDCKTCLDRVDEGEKLQDTAATDSQWVYRYERDGAEEGLREAQCQSAFPGLGEDIERAVKGREGRPVMVEELNALKMYKGMVRAMVYKGELYVLQVVCKGEDHRKKVVAALSSIFRAMTAIPHRRQLLPDIEFVFTIEDMADDPANPLWVLTRRAQDEQLWLMPDFGFWSWNVEGIGPYSEVVKQIEWHETDIEESWSKKIKKLVWRGKPSFAPKLRRGLIEAARGKSWSDVTTIRWEDNESMGKDFISSVDQCQYMFIAHVEGRSYSASLKYRQACRSVIVAHKLQWIQHQHFFLVANGTQQNFVEVERDFSDLEEKMEYLLAHPNEARRIADNSVKVFRERYLTPAAAACYWRALFQGWAKVAFKPELYETDTYGKRNIRGMRVESFLVLPSNEQLQFEARSSQLLNYGPGMPQS